MEDLEYWLDPHLLEAIVADVARVASEKTSLLRRIEEVRERIRAVLKPMRIPRASISGGIYAVDGASTSLELVGGALHIISYGYVSDGGDRWVSGRVDLEDSEQRRVEWLMELEVRRIATRVIRRRNPRIVLIDGEIGVHPLPYNLAVRGGAYERANTVMDRLLSEAARRGTSLVGVVKRVRSRLVSAVLGECIGLNDRGIGTLVLEPGEYAVLGKLGDLVERWAITSYGLCNRGGEEAIRCYLRGEAPKSARGAKLCSRIREAVRNMHMVFDSQEYPGLRMFRDMVLVLYRPSNGAPAVKAEVINADVGEVVAYLDATTSPTTGLPHLLDMVDRLVSLPRHLPQYVLSMLLRRVDAPHAHLFAKLASMQKAWLIGLDVA